MLEHVRRTLQKDPYHGQVDKFAELRLRIGVIDNPLVSQPDRSVKNDPHISPKGTVNMLTGKVAVKWIDGGQGGILRPPEFGSYLDSSSEREMVTLTMPMMFSDGSNWAGFHYLPPVGSICVIGFRKNQMPILLGYIHSSFNTCDPIKLGEIIIKGYGKNSTYWTQDNKMVHKAWNDNGGMTSITLTDNSIEFMATDGSNTKKFVIRPTGIYQTT